MSSNDQLRSSLAISTALRVRPTCDNGFTAESFEPVPWVNGSGDVSQDGRVIHGGSQSPQGATSFTFTHP